MTLDQIIHFWPVGVVGAFAVLAIIMGAIEAHRNRTVYVDPPHPPPPKENERLVPRFDDGQEFSTVEQIHAHYEAMKETDPKRAGREMYHYELKIHGK